MKELGRRCQRLKAANDEFFPNKTYKIAHKSDGIDKELVCPGCGANSWKYSDRTGVGKLPLIKMKLKCTECGLWFLVNRSSITKILGG